MPECHSTCPVRAVAYYRMSTDHQEDSIPQQQGRMRPKAKLAGIEIVREFQDEGVSGGGMAKRAAFKEMLDFCREQRRAGTPVEAVVCWDSKRFSRASSVETNHYVWEFMQAGVCRLFTYSDGWIDFRKEEDLLLFNIRQDTSNNRDLRERSKDIMRGKVENAQGGYLNGCSAPYGFDKLLLDERDDEVCRVCRGEKIKFKKEGWNVVLVPTLDPEPLEVVRWLFREYAYTETSYHALARQLNERKVPGPGTGLPHYEGRKEPPAWSTGQVKRILANPAYVGDYRYGRRASGAYWRFRDGDIRKTDFGEPPGVNQDPILLPDNHDPIIDRVTWDAVQAKAHARRAGKRKARAGGLPLTGIAHCGHCGARLYGQRFRVHTYLTCGGNRRTPGTCRSNNVREDRLLKALVGKVQSVYLAPERLEGLRRALWERVRSKAEAQPARAEGLRLRLAELDRLIRQGAKNLVRATDNLDLIQEELTGLRAQREKLLRDLESAERARGPTSEEAGRRVEAALARLEDLGRRLADAGPGQLGAVLRQIVYRVDVYWDEPRRAPGGKNFMSVFAKGVVKLRPAVEVSGNGAPASTSGRPRPPSASPAASPAATRCRPTSTGS